MTVHMKLGRRFHRDDRDREPKHLLVNHMVAAAKLPVSKTWLSSTEHLDQGNTGTCVGHGWRNFLRCAPIQTSAVSPSAFDIYRKAVLLDPWTDNDDEARLPDGDPGMDTGTTVRAGAKAMANMHRLTVGYAWAFTLAPAIEWLLTKGPLVVGVNWYDSMFTPDGSGLVTIAPGAALSGGHCFCVRGVNRSTGKVRCIQSWGNTWGHSGDFYLLFSDFERLILEDGEVCTAIQSN